MKRILKIGGIALLAIIVLLAVLPFLFKDKVKEVVINEVNDMLNAELYMGDFSMNFFKHFPNASVSIENVGVVGENEFAGDTLADIGKLTAVIDLSSLFADAYVINSIEIINPTFRAKVLEDGKANWDIMKSDSTESAEEDTTSSAAILLALDKFLIENLCASYDNKQDSMSASVDHLNLNLAGDLALDKGTLANIKTFQLMFDKVAYADDKSATTALLEKTKLDFSGNVSESVSDIHLLLDVDSISVALSNIPYLNKAKTNADIKIQADLANDKYTFGENQLSLNEIKANFSGFVQLIDTTAIDMDLALNTPGIDFKQILSLIPAIYADDFASIQTSGEVALSATAKGRMEGDTLPAINADLKISNAMFKYPDLPSSVNDINISANITNPGNITDSTVINVEKLGFKMAGNPFDVTLLMKTPISDPDFHFGANGTIDFSKLTEVVHLSDMKINGIMTAALKANGKMSYVDKEQYDLFTILGSLNLKDFILKMNSLDFDVNMNNANMEFTSQNVKMNADLGLGKSDLKLDGTLQNFLQYAVRGETIKGTLNVSSNYIDANELLGGEEEESANTNPESATENTIIDIPGNVDFALSTNINKLLFEDIEVTQLKGNLALKEKVAKISTLSGNTMGGSFNVNGEYDVKDTLSPKVDLALALKEMKISEVFTKVSTANKLAPILSDASGNFSMDLKFDSKLDHGMTPDLSTVNGKGKFSSREVGLNDVKAFSMIEDKAKAINSLANKIEMPSLKNPQMKDINIKFVIKNGRLEIDPFETAIQTALFKFSGSSGLDKTLDYISTISLKTITDKIPVALDVKIGGTFTAPKVTVGAGSTLESIKEKALEVVDKAKEKAIAEAKAQRDKMVAEAKAQREKMIAEAQKGADKLVEEAKANSQKLQDKATNPIAKAAAKKTGDAGVKKAQEQANKMVSDAAAAGDKLIQNAEKNGNALIEKASATGGNNKTTE